MMTKYSHLSGNVVDPFNLNSAVAGQSVFSIHMATPQKCWDISLCCSGMQKE